MGIPRYPRSTPGDPFNDASWVRAWEHRLEEEAKHKRSSAGKFGTAAVLAAQGFVMGGFIGGSVMVMHAVMARSFTGMGARAFTAGASFGTIFAVGNLVRNFDELAS